MFGAARDYGTRRNFRQGASKNKIRKKKCSYNKIQQQVTSRFLSASLGKDW
jgi:hypothetical protein